MIPDLSGSLRLSEEGIWFHDDHPFTNEKLIDLFFRSVVWDEEKNSFVLKIGQYGAVFKCEDTPFFVRSIEGKDSDWEIHLSDSTVERLDPTTIFFGSKNQAYCKIKRGHLARFTRSAHQSLMTHVEGDNTLRFGSEIVKVIR